MNDTCTYPRSVVSFESLSVEADTWHCGRQKNKIDQSEIRKKNVFRSRDTMSCIMAIGMVKYI